MKDTSLIWQLVSVTSTHSYRIHLPALFGGFTGHYVSWLQVNDALFEPFCVIETQLIYSMDARIMSIFYDVFLYNDYNEYNCQHSQF